jgi:hypothetical protein
MPRENHSVEHVGRREELVESLIELAILDPHHSFDSIFVVTNFLSVELKLEFGECFSVPGFLIDAHVS